MNLMGTSRGMLVGANLVFAATPGVEPMHRMERVLYPVPLTVPHARPLPIGDG